MFHNATGHSCPNCGMDHCVLNPTEDDPTGHSGQWYCFNCNAKGTYQTSFTIGTGSEPTGLEPQE